MTFSGADLTMVNAAATALDSASAGIQTIATAILSSQTAPASARDQVGTGLKTALSAMSNVTNLYIVSLVMKANERDTTSAVSDINNALTAGAAVVADCK